MPSAVPVGPDWNRLFEISAAQEGLFTTRQAVEVGYSPQLLLHHLRARRINRVHRGIYRLVHFPPGENEGLVAAWLWSEQAGVISHQTALALHDLSDAMVLSIHLTLPSTWRHRRLRVPDNVILHHADVPPDDRAWFGAAPATSPRRTLNDCAAAALSPDLLRQAAQQALRRGLVTLPEIGPVEVALQPFGGIAP